MEMILALAVVIAVIIFGGLISVGNERQRKAIEGLREQVVLWAIQDLRLKREKLAREVKIEDPLNWLNQVVGKVYGEMLDLTLTEIVEYPQTLVCASKDGRQVLFSHLSLKDFRRVMQKPRNRLNTAGNYHPFVGLDKHVCALEINVLNSGLLFDLELQMAWRQLTGHPSNQEDKLFMYIL